MGNHVMAVAVMALTATLGSGSPTAGFEPNDSSRGARSEVKAPEVWMCTAGALDLVEPGDDWQFVRDHLSGLQFYIDKLNAAPSDKLKQLADLVRESGIQISIECGGTLGFAPLDDTNGEQSARIELAKIDKWYRAGGTVDYLNLDGPVRRLLHPGRGREGFTSVERCAGELMDYIRAVKKAHPEIRFFLLTNFPNWGYRGGVSYHARGPNRQDWGDDHQVLTTVLSRAEAEGIEFAGVTVDNPYEYAVGEHRSVSLKDPTRIDWIARIRDYEQFARSRGLEFNLIINSEQGGRESDRAFYERTVKMLDAYMAAGGKPTRYFVQSWYPFPKTIVPETAPSSMTGLVKEVIRRLHAARQR